MNLVTGATGILGSHVALVLLRRGETVLAARREGSSIEKAKRLFSYYGEENLFSAIRWVTLDVTDIYSVSDAVEQVKNVYHCAGMVSFSPQDHSSLFRINEEGTRNIVNACIHAGSKTLCHASSLATIRNPDWSGPLDETVFWKTSGRESDYAVSKYNAEREVWRGMEEGLDAVIVNPGVILSPGFRDQSSSRLFGRCYRGNRFYTDGQTGYIGAMDVAVTMTRLLGEKRFGERYILVEGNYTFREIFARIQSRFGRKAPDIRLSPFMLKAGQKASAIAAFVTGRRPEVSKAMVRSLLNRQVYSNQKIRTQTGVEFEPVPALIDAICAHYLEELKAAQ